MADKMVNKELKEWLGKHKKKAKKHLKSNPKYTIEQLQDGIDRIKEKETIIKKIITKPGEMERIEKMLEATK